MVGQLHIATADERDTMLAGLLRAKVRELRAERDAERAAINRHKVRLGGVERALRAAMSNAAMCEVSIEPEPAAPSDPLFAECTGPAYARDAEPYTAAELARMTGLEP